MWRFWLSLSSRNMSLVSIATVELNGPDLYSANKHSVRSLNSDRKQGFSVNWHVSCWARVFSKREICSCQNLISETLLLPRRRLRQMCVCYDATMLRRYSAGLQRFFSPLVSDEFFLFFVLNSSFSPRLPAHICPVTRLIHLRSPPSEYCITDSGGGWTLALLKTALPPSRCRTVTTHAVALLRFTPLLRFVLFSSYLYTRFPQLPSALWRHMVSVSCHLQRRVNSLAWGSNRLKRPLLSGTESKNENKRDERLMSWDEWRGGAYQLVAISIKGFKKRMSIILETNWTCFYILFEIVYDHFLW